MKNLNIVVLVILAKLQYSSADIKCTLKEGVSQALNKVSDVAIKGIRFHGGRTKGNMQLFECTCDDDDVSKFLNYFE